MPNAQEFSKSSYTAITFVILLFPEATPRFYENVRKIYEKSTIVNRTKGHLENSSEDRPRYPKSTNTAENNAFVSRSSALNNPWNLSTLTVIIDT